MFLVVHQQIFDSNNCSLLLEFKPVFTVVELHPISYTFAVFRIDLIINNKSVATRKMHLHPAEHVSASHILLSVFFLVSLVSKLNRLDAKALSGAIKKPTEKLSTSHFVL